MQIYIISLLRIHTHTHTRYAYSARLRIIFNNSGIYLRYSHQSYDVSTSSEVVLRVHLWLAWWRYRNRPFTVVEPNYISAVEYTSKRIKSHLILLVYYFQHVMHIIYFWILYGWYLCIIHNLTFERGSYFLGWSRKNLTPKYSVHPTYIILYILKTPCRGETRCLFHSYLSRWNSCAPLAVIKEHCCIHIDLSIVLHFARFRVNG
jgi:hypothetical protein